MVIKKEKNTRAGFGEMILKGKRIPRKRSGGLRNSVPCSGKRKESAG